MIRSLMPTDALKATEAKRKTTLSKARAGNTSFMQKNATLAPCVRHAPQTRMDERYRRTSQARAHRSKNNELKYHCGLGTVWTSSKEMAAIKVHLAGMVVNLKRSPNVFRLTVRGWFDMPLEPQHTHYSLQIQITGGLFHAYFPIFPHIQSD
nr:hypothetical protein [Paenibacillus daejeonensis]